MPQYGAVLQPGGALKEGLSLEAVAQAIAEPGTVGWVDLEGATLEEIAALESPFGFHPLAVEDAQNPATRPKIEEYEGFLFIVTRAINHNEGQPALDLITLSIFLNRRVIVTVHEHPMKSVEMACDRLRRHPDVLAGGPDRLLHHLLDQVVDYYFPFVERLEEAIESLEDAVFTSPRPALLESIFRTRKEVVTLRRSLGPLRGVLVNLMSGLPYIDAELRPFFRDVYDNVLRALDELDMCREVLAGLLESYLSQVNNRLSEVMKRLTALAVIGLPMTIISGFFGMNFDLLPWTKQPWGVLAAVAVMVAASGALYYVFQRREWL